MMKLNWLKWIVYLVMAMLVLEVLKVVVMKIPFAANYFVAIILISLQTMVVFGFVWFAILASIFRRRLNRRKLNLYWFVSIIIIVTGCELLFSYWLYHPTRIPATLKWSYKYYYDVYNFRILQFEKDAIALDTGLLYTLKPGSDFLFTNAEFKTNISINKAGCRDDDSSAKAPEIICLGDSFTMGWGLDESQTFPAIIERRTGKKVLNAGIPSYGTVRELLLLNRLDTSALKYVIIQYCANDREENASFLGNNGKLQLTPLPSFRSAVNTYQHSRNYFPGKHFLMISQLWLKKQVNNIYPVFKLSADPYRGTFKDAEHVSVFLQVFTKLRERFRHTTFIVTQVDINKYRQNSFISMLEQESRKLVGDGRKRLVFVNSTVGLTNEDYFILDYHLTATGQEKVADKIIDAIKKDAGDPAK